MSSRDVSTLLDDNIVVNVVTGTPPIFWGPSSTFGYTVLQGLFTVLAIKEVVSVTRNAIKGSPSSLCPNRTILMSMVENWEDLAKVFRHLVWQRPLHKPSRDAHVTAPLNRVGWTRFLLSGIIAFWLFGIDMALIVLSVPNRLPQNIESMTKVKWANTGKIPKLTKETTLHGSFSKAIKFEPIDNDVEFTRLPAVSLERTDFRDFGEKLPTYDGRFFSCSNEEIWRIVCKVRCKERFYQYKLRIDIVTDTNTTTFYVPTTDFSVTGTHNNLGDYAKEIQKQLGIEVSQTIARKHYFEFNSVKEPNENTTIDGKRVLTHDAIATLFLASIEISQAPSNATYFGRAAGKREEKKNQEPHGVIAISQRPYLPFLGTAAFYVFMQVISIIQQKAWKLHTHSNDMTAILEVCGGNIRENIANIVVEDRPLVESTYEGPGTFFEHVGYLPAAIVVEIKEFLEEFSTYKKMEESRYSGTGETAV